MATFTGLTFVSPGIKPIGAGSFNLPFQNHSSFLYRFKRLNFDSVSVSKRVKCYPKAYNGRNYEASYNDGSQAEPYLLKQMKEAVMTVRNLLGFLVEQPSQLKYIEWPSFQSTLKTATLTLVLVAFLIVALSSVDAALSFLLALLLRRKA